ALIERIVSRREGVLAHEGAVIVRTGIHTGRSANDKFIVRDETTDETVHWGKINRPYDLACFDRLHVRMSAYLQGRDVFIQDTTAGAHQDYRLPIRVITENAWHSLFARNLFIRRPPEELADHVPGFTVIQAPGFRAIPDVDCTNSEVFIVVNFSKRLVLIGGTSYAGEIKKSIFTILNYLLPRQDVMPCSANIGPDGDVALFFGLSGTGKTTLSSDTDRTLIGDDEHGWGEDGVFNFEGGCYAKVIRLREELEPLIWHATRHFGTILENVNIDAVTRRINFDDASYTENTRAAYPIGFLPNTIPSGLGGHPKQIFFLTADASGVLPPVARLSEAQALYYFLSGYTSKLAGTEKGLGSEPQATFSTCFGAPFMPLDPVVYARLLGEKIRQHKTEVWLINTGWTGGSFGVGKRMPLPYTRAMVHAIYSGDLKDVPLHRDRYFNLQIPQSCPGVPAEMLQPQHTWQDQDDYDRQARLLASRFRDNFVQFAGSVSSMPDRLSRRQHPKEDQAN
ncbi:MAG: phosphoenolpyruvate carboxykinase (ATP), partial [Anaerolineales bacterium]